jgi:uncharacterized protein YjdB
VDRLVSITIQQDGRDAGESIDMVPGEEEAIQLTVKYNPTTAPDADKVITWTSSAPNVATVEDGKVTGHEEGTAIITAIAAGKTAAGAEVKAELTVQVKQAVRPQAVKIYRGETLVSGETIKIVPNMPTQLTAVVEPNNVLSEDKEITWTSDPAGLVSSEGLVTLTAEGGTITATAAGKDADGQTVSATVTVAPLVLDVVLFNQRGDAAPADGTTTTLPAVNENGRWVINNTQDALFANDILSLGTEGTFHSWRDNLLVYLDAPLEGDFEFEARVKINKFNNTLSYAKDTAWHGAWIGAFSNPTMTNAEFPTANLGDWAFFASRKIESGDDRMPATRDEGYIGGSSFTVDNLWVPKTYTYEYTYYIRRQGSGTTANYVLEVRNPKTGAVMASGERSVSEQTLNDKMGGPVYVGVMMSDAEVEISNFTVKQDSTVIYQQTPSDATSVKATAIALSAASQDPSPDFGLDDVRLLNDIRDGIQLNAALTPVNSTDDVVYSLPEDTVGAAVDGTGRVTVTAQGDYTITATALDYKDKTPGATKTYVLKVLASEPFAESVEITDKNGRTSFNTLNVGTYLFLKATVNPAGASKEIMWMSSDTSIATVANGKVTGLSQGTAKIQAISPTGASGEIIEELEITVGAPLSGQFVWKWETGGVIPGPGVSSVNRNTEVVNSDGSKTAGFGGYMNYSWWTSDDGAHTKTEEGKWNIANGRFILGTPSNSPATTGTSFDTRGELSLVTPIKITVEYDSITTNANNDSNNAFILYLDANASGATATNTIFGPSAILVNHLFPRDIDETTNAPKVTTLPAGKLEYYFDPADLQLGDAAVAAGIDKDEALSYATLQFRFPSGITASAVTKFAVEYIDAADIPADE